MMRVLSIAAAVLCMHGCFVFDNPFDTGSATAITFQIVITSTGYAGTYVWNPHDNAYETVLGGTPYYVYLDSNGVWCLSGQLNQTYGMGTVITHGVLLYSALPPTTASAWAPVLSNVDDSVGGICRTLVAPDSTPTSGSTLRVTFKSSGNENGAIYKWEKSASLLGTSAITIGTGPTFPLTSTEIAWWIRVVITPTDGAGVAIGTPVTSPPVYVPN